MKVLISLPPKHKSYDSADDIISGQVPASGTDGAMIRLAGLLAEAGIEVYLSVASPIISHHFKSINHSAVKAEEFDYLIAHEFHWNGVSLTFGNHVLPKTFLWLHNQADKLLIFAFLREGGQKVICPSQYLAKLYRMLPGWQDKVVVIPNLYSPIFRPIPSREAQESAVPRLLFIGALSTEKGLVELTQIWSYLAQRQVPLEFAIAGSINLHQGYTTGALGLVEPDLESSVILPWLNSLPKGYQPKFLGLLSPAQLQIEIAKSWAVIVNPSLIHLETFCISAVEAEACDRTVFSVQAGALPETVYQGQFQSLGKGDAVEAVSDRIIEGLSNKKLVAENGRLAGEFVRHRFNNQLICNAWIELLKGQKNDTGLPKFGDSFEGLVQDLIRWSRIWKIMRDYKRGTEHYLRLAYRRMKGKA